VSFSESWDSLSDPMWPPGGRKSPGTPSRHPHERRPPGRPGHLAADRLGVEYWTPNSVLSPNAAAWERDPVQHGRSTCIGISSPYPDLCFPLKQSLHASCMRNCACTQVQVYASDKYTQNYDTAKGTYLLR
jgi:hypothetical protein